MSEFFDKSRWSKKDKVELYLKHSHLLIPVRSRMSELLTSFAGRFVESRGAGRDTVRILDLGCGDGAMVEGVVKALKTEVTFIDASEDMLERARSRYKSISGVTFLKASFEDIIEEKVEVTRPEGGFDLIVSAFAIHHLTTKERLELFRKAAAMSADRGWFINMDTVLSASGDLEDWYMELRKAMSRAEARRVGLEDDIAGLDDFVAGHKNPAHHERLDTLEVQMKALTEAGYRSVDCFYKEAIFAMYGGCRRYLRTAGRTL